jgi:hypothetical protein
MAGLILFTFKIPDSVRDNDFHCGRFNNRTVNSLLHNRLPERGRVSQQTAPRVTVNGLKGPLTKAAGRRICLLQTLCAKLVTDS